VKKVSELEEGLSDILTGIILLTPLVVTSSFDATITHKHVNLKKLVPCPKAIPGAVKY
jgi:hypothetical protein